MRLILSKMVRVFSVGFLAFLIMVQFSACGRFAKTEQPGEAGPAPGESVPWYSPKKKPQTQPQPAPPEITYYVHTVKWQGESVSIISAWYTGTIDNWKELAAANPDINPDRIFVGNKIRVPEHLMTTRSPMPEEFVWNFVPKQKKHTPAKPSAPKKTEEPELFGPKELPPKK